MQLAWALLPAAQGRGLATEAALAAVEEARALAPLTLAYVTEVYVTTACAGGS